MNNLWWMKSLCSPEGRRFLALYKQTVQELATGKVYAYALLLGGNAQQPSISLKPVYDFESIAKQYYPNSLFWLDGALVLVCDVQAQERVADDNWLANVRSYLAADLPQRRPALPYTIEMALHTHARNPAATQVIALTNWPQLPATYFLN